MDVKYLLCNNTYNADIKACTNRNICASFSLCITIPRYWWIHQIFTHFSYRSIIILPNFLLYHAKFSELHAYKPGQAFSNVIIPVHTYSVSPLYKVSNLIKGTSPSSDLKQGSANVFFYLSLRYPLTLYLLSPGCCRCFFSYWMSDLCDTQLDVQLEFCLVHGFVFTHVGLCRDTAPSTLCLSFTSQHPIALPSFHLISSTLIAIVLFLKITIW